MSKNKNNYFNYLYNLISSKIKTITKFIFRKSSITHNISSEKNDNEKNEDVGLITYASRVEFLEALKNAILGKPIKPPTVFHGMIQKPEKQHLETLMQALETYCWSEAIGYFRKTTTRYAYSKINCINVW